MALFQFQKLLLNMYTNKRLLEEYLENPYDIVQKYQLSKKESGVIEKIPKETLISFNESLLSKRTGVAHKLIENFPNLIVASSFYIQSPALFFIKNSSNNVIELKENEFKILSKLETITPKNLFTAYMNTDTASIKSISTLSWLFSKESLWNKEIKIL